MTIAHNMTSCMWSLLVFYYLPIPGVRSYLLVKIAMFTTLSMSDDGGVMCLRSVLQQIHTLYIRCKLYRLYTIIHCNH
jgi:hypothetical protein